MSFLNDDSVNIPQGHESAAINPQTTVSDATKGGPAFRHEQDVGARSKPVRLQKTNPAATAASRTGAPVRKEMGLKAHRKDVMVRSGNQEGRQVGVPDGFIWGMQGQGTVGQEAPPEPGLPTWVKLAGAGVMAWLLYRTLAQNGKSGSQSRSGMSGAKGVPI